MAAFYGPTEIDWLAHWIETHAAEGTPATATPPSWGRDLLEGMVTSVAYQL